MRDLYMLVLMLRAGLRRLGELAQMGVVVVEEALEAVRDGIHDGR